MLIKKTCKTKAIYVKKWLGGLHSHVVCQYLPYSGLLYSSLFTHVAMFMRAIFGMPLMSVCHHK